MRLKNIIFRLLKIERFLDPLSDAKRKGMIVGKGVTLASKRGTSFGSEPYLIELKDYARLSGNNTFITHDGGTYAFRDMEEYRGVQKFGSIVVGEHSFIGYGAIIMPGVKIGKRAVIAAGSVVTKSVPDEEVWGGVPAKRICSLKDYADKCMRYSKENFDADTMKRNGKKKYLQELREHLYKQ